ncbi:hypothetical protein E2C01_016699 [Portunus trituberculatus]|uniref:Uncharacterized protein n=1 Tax=Portunus trituberculatus TaxID=210409 RepID=A0A5B7DQ58_PORTR|nr:hypothetical protein [Portunus trituberculatus]
MSLSRLWGEVGGDEGAQSVMNSASSSEAAYVLPSARLPPSRFASQHEHAGDQSLALGSPGVAPSSRIPRH